MSDHRLTLIMNTIRSSLENLARTGVGYIDCEYTTEIFYKIDDVVFSITVGEALKEDEE